MSETPTDVTPTDSATESAGKKKIPQRGIRRRVMGEGEGDYYIYEIAPPESKLPKGSMIPIPKVPRFLDTAAAIKWIKNESGDLLIGKQVMVFRACEIMSLRAETRPTVVIECKPKITVTDPKAAETSDG